MIAHTYQTFLFTICNSLYIPSLEHNLIPPFIMRETGTVVNNTLKIHVPNPESTNCALTFPDSKLKVPLQLWGKFSYFPSRMTASDEIHSCENIFLTLDGANWDP